MITKNYIKMCEKAEEIQKPLIPLWSFVIVKKCWATKKREIGIITNFEKKHKRYNIFMKGNPYGTIEQNNLIWLPTQEQLWEMVKEIYFTENSELMIRNDLKRDIYSASIYTEIDDNINTENVEGKIVKECLLKLIMKEYCKIWTGEKWAKEQ